MDQLLAALARHGIPILAGVVFLEAVGFPVPASLALLAAGGFCARGIMDAPSAVAAALGAMLAGDVIMYLLGRFTGWWLLTILCRVSLNPESCIIRSAEMFYRRGRAVLIFAKFLPGINTMAPPLAGSMSLPAVQFVPLDLAGAALYIGAFWGSGYIFSDLVGRIAGAWSRFGDILGAALGILAAAWFGWHIFHWFRSKIKSGVVRLTPDEVARIGASAAIYDVRSHGYYDKGAMRIAGSSRLEPNSLTQDNLVFPEGREIVLYCTCYREVTSDLVARHLATLGIRASVIVGGYQAWKKAGLPLEAVPAREMVNLPTFGKAPAA